MTSNEIEEGIILEADYVFSKYYNDYAIELEIKGYNTWGFACMRFVGQNKINQLFNEFFYDEYNKKISDMVHKEIVMMKPKCWTCVPPAIARYDPNFFPEHHWVYNDNKAND